MQRRLDGFTLVELIGFGETGEVWRARPHDPGPEVTITWPADGALDETALRSARLKEFKHPHVRQLLDIRRDGSSVVLIHQFVAGVSLADLLAERERLSSAEVVTLLTPIADALCAAHEVGLIHGNLTPTAVLVTPDGRPMLTELGLAKSLGDTAASKPPEPEYLDPAVDGGEPPTAATDVYGLAAIGFRALAGHPPCGEASIGPDSRLAEVLARGLSERPQDRGSARAFAADVRDALEPEPLLLAGPYVWPDLPPLAEPDADGPDAARRRADSMDIASEVRRGGAARHTAAPVGRGQRGPHDVAGSGLALGRSWALRTGARVVPRPAVIAAVIVLAALCVIVLGLGWNSSRGVPAQAGAPIGSESASAGPDDVGSESGPGFVELAVPDSPQGWVDLLNLLYERRALAFATGSVVLLDQVFTVDSPQMAADATELTRLLDAGQVLRGFAPHVLEVHEAVVDGAQASLRITDEFPAYETVPATDTGATALAEHAGRGPVPVAMTLVLTEQGWRIATATRLG